MVEKNYFDNLGRYLKAISIFKKYFIKKPWVGKFLKFDRPIVIAEFLVFFFAYLNWVFKMFLY